MSHIIESCFIRLVKGHWSLLWVNPTYTILLLPHILWCNKIKPVKQMFFLNVPFRIVWHNSLNGNSWCVGLLLLSKRFKAQIIGVQINDMTCLYNKMFSKKKAAQTKYLSHWDVEACRLLVKLLYGLIYFYFLFWKYQCSQVPPSALPCNCSYKAAG